MDTKEVSNLASYLYRKLKRVLQFSKDAKNILEKKKKKKKKKVIVTIFDNNRYDNNNNNYNT